MGGKMRGGGNVILFPEPPVSFERRGPHLSGRLKPAPEGPAKLLPVPPKTISVHRAMKELARRLGELDQMLYTRLCFPRKVKFSSYPDGMEFYDLKSRRAVPWTPGETLAETESWVRSWYFSVFETSPGRLVGRYIDREHPDFIDGRRLGSLEQVLKDPISLERDGMEYFIEKIRSKP